MMGAQHAASLVSALLLQAVLLFAATAGAAGEQNVGPAAFASCLASGAPPSQRATRPLHAAPSFPGCALRASVPTKLRLSGIKLARTQGYSGLRGLAAGAKDAWSFTGANTALQDMLGMGAGVTGQDVCTFRHDGLGTGLELWHGSFGWFDFVTCAGAPVVLTDTWGIQVERPSEMFSSGGQQYSMLTQASKAPDGGLYRMPEGEQPIKAGTWTAKVEGDYIVIKNQYASRQSIVLSDTGFVFLGSRGTSIAVTNAQPPVEMPLEDALALVPGVLLK